MRKKRLLWQIYASYLAITLVSLAALTWYASRALRQFYLEQTASDLEARARLVEEQFCRELAAGQPGRTDALCKELGRKAFMRITLILPDGKVLGDSDESPQTMENHADRPEVIEALSGGVGVSLRFSRTLQENRRYVAIPLRHERQVIGVLRTSISLAAIDRALDAIQARIVAGGLLAAGLVAGLGWLASRRITRPLEHLQRGAERFAQGDLAHQLPPGNSREIDALAETLNRMAAELDEKIGVAVQERNEREAILSSMVEGVFAVDSEERLLRINQAAARLLGIDARWAEGRTLQEVVRHPRLQQLVSRVLASQQPAEDEIVLRDSGERFLQAHGTVLRDAREGRVGVLVVLHDVTRLKRLEKVRQDFVANVSHELRTPVTSIKGFVETLLDGAMHNSDELQRFLHIVAAQTDRLGAIIEDLLTLSRIEREEEKSELALSSGLVKSVLEAAMVVCQSKAAEKGIDIELSCDEQLQAGMNSPLLEQAVINLLDNAVKYSPPGGTVHLEGLCCENEMVIRVRDHGCGISREHLPRIFERFYRVDKARSRSLGGTGLGLAIVKHIAQAHGGRAVVESSVGQGSTFSIHWPGRL